MSIKTFIEERGRIMKTFEELYKDAQEHKAEKYTDDMYRMLDNLSQRRYSTNKVLNIILNDKIEKQNLMYFFYKGLSLYLIISLSQHHLLLYPLHL